MNKDWVFISVYLLTCAFLYFTLSYMYGENGKLLLAGGIIIFYFFYKHIAKVRKKGKR
jgi:hypothetical protein